MRIKVLARGVYEGYPDFEYAPGYVFVMDPSCTDYDWLVVYDEMPDRDVGTVRNGCEKLKCPKECTILATTEPVSIKSYSRSYTAQFGHFLTNRPKKAENHPGYHLGRGYYWWYLNRTYHECMTRVLPEKDRLISCVSSSKKMRHTKHAARYNLAAHLQTVIPGIEWFGRGVRPFEKKYEVLEPYKYHVTIENYIGVHHWSEKLADALLAECLPFYAGDPAIDEIFPKESIISIPIDDPKAAAEIIKAAIASGEYEKRREAVLEAKRLILTRYNFWAQIIEVIDASHDRHAVHPDPMKPILVFERKRLRRKSLSAAIEEGFLHLRDYIRRGMCI